MLNQLTHNHTTQQQYRLEANTAMALVSTKTLRGFQFSKRWNKQTHECSKHSFPIAMPAILNIAAVDTINSCLNVNCLTKLQSIWGGTHDALLGLVFWLYRIPVLSMANIYQEKQATNEIITRIKNDTNNLIFIIHRVKNMLTVRGVQIASQYNISELFDDVYFNGNGHILNIADDVKQSQQELSVTKKQVRIGAEAAIQLIRLPDSTVNKTIFAHKSRLLPEIYQDFNFNDCAWQN